MEAIGTSLLVLLLIGIYLGLGVWVFAGLLLVSFTGMGLVLDFPMVRIALITKQIIWRGLSGFEITAIPLFLLMGEIIYRTDISDRLFRGLVPIVSKLPGRLLHVNVLGCTLFAAISGSSTATTAVVGKITIQELNARGYDERLSVGSLAGAGSFGLLIPPSIILIVYGILAEVSIVRLFSAGLLPGLMLAALFSAYIILRCAANPALAPPAGTGAENRLRALLGLVPILLLILVVLGSIYSGLATPSEAAAIGVFVAFLIAAVSRQLTWSLLQDAFLGAVTTSAMICSILAAATLLTTVMGYLHVPQEIATAIDAFGPSPAMTILLIAVLYIFLGLFLDGISITVMSLPITLPMVIHAGYDPLWFGVFLVVMVELGSITPPVGFNLFVLQGVARRSLGFVALSAAPFFVILCLGSLLLAIFPAIAEWLPSVLYGS